MAEQEIGGGDETVPQAPANESREVTEEEIARRAYEISGSDEAGSPQENWERAARELRGETGDAR